MARKTNVYIVGSGGREAMTAWMLKRSKSVNMTLVGPGNGDTGRFTTNTEVVPDYPSCGNFISFLKEKRIDTVVSGSETDLVKGLGDMVRMHNIGFIGASSAAAKFEGSKIFARDFMAAYKINHPPYEVFATPDFESNKANAIAYAQGHFSGRKDGLVIKADGLCGGKGVTIAHNLEEFEKYVNGLAKFGEAGKKFLVEKMLTGAELSVTACIDDTGHNFFLLPFSQDYKRQGEGDTGENTGGMGAVSVDVPDDLSERIEQEIVEPTLRGARDIHHPLRRCVLYVGLMISPQGKPSVLEYNVRFGDPETQVVLPRIKSDFGEFIHNWAHGDGVFDSSRGAIMQGTCKIPDIDKRHYATVVMAAKGYPGNYKASEGTPISGIEKARSLKDVIVNIAGTRFDPAKGIYTVKGSRNINVIGCGETQEKALERAYEGVDCIKSDGLFYRKDIGCNLGQIRALGGK